MEATPILIKLIQIPLLHSTHWVAPVSRNVHGTIDREIEDVRSNILPLWLLLALFSSWNFICCNFFSSLSFFSISHLSLSLSTFWLFVYNTCWKHRGFFSRERDTFALRSQSSFFFETTSFIRVFTSSIDGGEIRGWCGEMINQEEKRCCAYK